MPISAVVTEITGIIEATGTTPHITTTVLAVAICAMGVCRHCSGQPEPLNRHHGGTTTVVPDAYYRTPPVVILLPLIRPGVETIGAGAGAIQRRSHGAQPPNHRRKVAPGAAFFFWYSSLFFFISFFLSVSWTSRGRRCRSLPPPPRCTRVHFGRAEGQLSPTIRRTIRIKIMWKAERDPQDKTCVNCYSFQRRRTCPPAIGPLSDRLLFSRRHVFGCLEKTIFQFSCRRLSEPEHAWHDRDLFGNFCLWSHLSIVQ